MWNDEFLGMLDLQELDVALSEDEQIEISVSTEGMDYNMAINKPSINGTTLVGNYDEIDPTVPRWAKTPTKPLYNADEVGAVDSNNNITNPEIDAIIDAIFI